MLRFVLGLLCVTIALTAPAHAVAPADSMPPLKVVLLPMNPRLERALRTALTPWKMRVERVDDRQAAVVQRSVLGATELARVLGADAVVWLVTRSPTAALWVYDARSDSAAVRSVPGKWLSPALAAALALSVKTLLRSVDDPTTADAPSDAEPETWQHIEAVTQQTPEVVRATALGTSTPPVAISSAEPTSYASWQLTLSGGLRLRARGETAEPRYGIGVRYVPGDGIGSEHAAPWLGLNIEAGIPQDASRGPLRGEYWDMAAGLSAGVTQPLSRWLRASVALGVELHASSLSGSLLPDGTETRQWRVSPALRLRPGVDVVLGRVIVGVEPGAGVFLRRQRYTIDGEAVLETRSLWWTLGIGVGVLL